MRVCQFRHDGKWTFIAAATHRRRVRKTYASILQARRRLSNQPDHSFLRETSCPSWFKLSIQPYSSFAVIVIFAFNTFDTGQPFSAASAYF
jgi:hypothetical protein